MTLIDELRELHRELLAHDNHSPIPMGCDCYRDGETRRAALSANPLTSATGEK